MYGVEVGQIWINNFNKMEAEITNVEGSHFEYYISKVDCIFRKHYKVFLQGYTLKQIKN